jgi:hypothetical protein
MEKIRNRAITALDYMDLSPVERIVLAVNHDIPTWLKPAYFDLCIRQEALREDEARELGLSTTVKLACARERLREESQRDRLISGKKASREDMYMELAKSIIEEIFNPEEVE